jgi:DNA-binding IclR family transcriptional regulator
MGLVEQAPDTGRYDLGPFALQLGLAAMGRLEPVGIAGKILQELADELQQTAAVAVWANYGATIVRWVGAESPVSATLRVGSVMPLSRSATGLLFAALQPSALCSALLKTELADNARRHVAPQSLADVERRLAIVRRDGYAHTSAFIPGITGMAAPVYRSDMSLALALVTLGYSDSFDKNLERIRSVLLHYAQRLSQRLGATRLPACC